MTKKKPALPQTGTLNESDLVRVSGGLNPQPLPPRWQ